MLMLLPFNNPFTNYMVAPSRWEKELPSLKFTAVRELSIHPKFNFNGAKLGVFPGAGYTLDPQLPCESTQNSSGNPDDHA